MIQLDGFVGFCSVKNTLTFPGQFEWSKDKIARLTLAGGNIGYSLIERNNLNVFFLTGVGTNIMGSPPNEHPENKQNGPSLRYYKFCFNVEFKNMKGTESRISINYADISYLCLRVSLGMTKPLRTPEFPEYYEGSVIYFSVGIGGLSRGYRKKS